MNNNQAIIAALKLARTNPQLADRLIQQLEQQQQFGSIQLETQLTHELNQQQLFSQAPQLGEFSSELDLEIERSYQRGFFE